MGKVWKPAARGFFCLFISTAAALGATPSDFYLNLLHRGIAHVETGQYDAGSKELRVAAFGLLESIAPFETAQIYLAIAAEKLGTENEVRRAVQRVATADKVEQHYSALVLPKAVRAAFEKLAIKELSSEQITLLHRTAVAAPPQPEPPSPEPAQSSAALPAEQPAAAPQPPPAAVPPSEPAATPASKTSGVATDTAPAVASSPPREPDVSSALASADDDLRAGKPAEAAAKFQSIVDSQGLDHVSALRTGVGATRAGDFRTAIRAFARAGSFGANEQPYRYYFAVALYETGKFGEAKHELAAALPHIPVTREVTLYRKKIEAAVE
jgi:tetratricopeptide (TPR) repeat protein